MRFTKLLAAMVSLLMILSACGTAPAEQKSDRTEIRLTDDEVTLNGVAVGTDTQSGVYIANDIVYYESGKDFTYGEGSEKDAHTPQEAAAHTVVHITQPGTYSVTGKLSKGQLAVDLGEDAKEDPNAVVTLILNGADITCEVAPAVIFYNVYECGDPETPSKDVDTSQAGANVIIADGSENSVNGAYVARIYEPDSVVLNEDGTEVEDAKKLHKYDGAFYSRMSMNIGGETEGSGVLNIHAQNEGLDSEMHLTLNGGSINIYSGNDGINTNEDGVSVTTINAGKLNIQVTGETGEGDGIDSNGWLVINGGTVIAAACANSADAGIDSDMGIHIGGGTVIATGSMLDRIEDGGQTYAVFNFAQKQSGTDTVYFKNEQGEALLEHSPQNDYSILIYSSPALTPGSYTLWSGEQQMAGQSGGMGFGPGMPGGEGMTPPEGMELPEGMTHPEGMERPEGMEPPEGMTRPTGQEGMEPPEDFMMPDGQMPPERPQRPTGEMDLPDGGKKPDQNGGVGGELSTQFVISAGGNMFAGITLAT